MLFAADHALDLPCHFSQLIEGEQYHDGRRYLPTIVLTPPVPHDQAANPLATTLPVVDRHHLVDLTQVGQQGSAKLVLLLCQFKLQSVPYRRGLMDVGSPVGVPLVYGQVTEVAVWELPTTPLPYESLYCEFVLDIGGGTVGVRTHATATDLAKKLGTAKVNRGDWVVVRRPRIDILAFTPAISTKE
jgi:hypothetical protein